MLAWAERRQAARSRSDGSLSVRVTLDTDSVDSAYRSVCAVDRQENRFRGGDVADNSALRRHRFITELNISVSGLRLSK